MKSSANSCGAGHLLDRPVGDAGVREVDQHVGEPRVLLRAQVGPAQQEHPVGAGRARRPDLLAGDDDLVAADDALGLHGGQVGAVVGLGEALAVHVLAGDDPGQEVRPLLGRAVHDDGRADQGLAHAAAHPRHARPVELLVEHGESHRVQALPAELFRPLRADQPLGLQLGRPLRVGGVGHGPGELAAAPAAGRHDHVPVEEAGEPGRRLGGDPVPQLRAELRDLRAKVKFHGAPPGVVRLVRGTASRGAQAGRHPEVKSRI